MRGAGYATWGYRLALDAGFDEFWVRYNRGSLLLRLGRRDEARQDLRRAVHLAPNHEEARRMLATIEASPATRPP